MRIVMAGSIAYDYLMTFPGYFKDHFLMEKIDKISLSFLVDGMTRHYGGVAPNIAYNYALLGGRGTILGTAGAADFSDYAAKLERDGVDLAGVKLVADMFTASFFANTDRANNQIASFFPGAMAHAHTCRVADLGYKPDLVVISADDPVAMQAHVRECKALGINYMFDPSQQLVRMSRDEVAEGVEGAHMLAVNEYEWHLIQENLKITREDILRQGVILVNTLGADGSVVYADDREFRAPAATVDTIKDPTGAGDAFRGGFLRGVAAGLPYDVASKMGALTAAYCIEHVGTQNHRFTLDAFVARYAVDFGSADELAPLEVTAA